MSATASVTTLLADATTRLAESLKLEKREARIEARVLLAHALSVDHAWLIAHDRDTPAAAQLHAIESLIARRITGEPVAYILGEREFYGRTFKISPDVLIPRPETELLVEAALERLPGDRPSRILDLGTGSGCVAISIALERMNCEVLAIDVSIAALALAKENARRLGASNVRLLISDWYAQLDTMNFDMIISNPPYIPSGDPHLSNGGLLHEPQNALASGPSGLDAIRAIVAGAPAHLQADGWLILEHGYDQASSCTALLHQAGLRQIFTLTDLANHNRISGGQWRGRQ